MARTPPPIVRPGDLRPADKRRRHRPSMRRVWRRRILIAAMVLVALGAVLAALVGLVAIGVARDARDGREAFSEARAALIRQDADLARASFEGARNSFASANARLDGATALPLRVLPVVSTQGDALRSMARAGALAAQAGRGATDAIDPAPAGGWGLQRGRIDVGAVRRASGFMRNAVGFGELAVAELDAAPTGWLAGPVADALAEADELLTGAVEGLTAGRDALEALPTLLGQGSTQRYVVAFANLSELRGTGGFIGYYAVAEATDGQISNIEEDGRPTQELPELGSVPVEAPDWFEAAYGERYGATELWQNVNMSIDFPTPARIMADASEVSLERVDGVIQVDPVAIAALMRLTGPVTIDAWPSQINADNVEEITQHRQYLAFDSGRQRTALNSQLIDAVFERVLSSDIAFSQATLSELGQAALGGHLKVFSRDAQAQRALETIGLSGSIERADEATDVLSVVTQNAAGNKVDWFLRREVVYRVALDPRDGSATTEITATLANKAPSAGMPAYIIGPNIPGLSGGMNQQIAVVLRSPTDELERFELGGEDPGGVVHEREGRYRTYHAGVVIASGQRNQLLVSSRVPGAVVGEGAERRYRLRVLAHPSAHADFYDVQIEAPKGWTTTGTTSFLGTLDGDLTLEVTLRKTARASFVDTVLLDPWRWFSGLF